MRMVVYECPQTLEERGPVSVTNVTSSAVPSGPLFERNLDSSVPDAYRAPPMPVPYDGCLECSHALPGKFADLMKSGHMQPADSASIGEAVVMDGNLKDSEYKIKVVGEEDNLKAKEDEPSKLSKSDGLATEEEDVCPTCLEEYDSENPRIITKCGHHFHLSCILEWMERSDTCAICDKIMMFDV
ncbi:probable E3 ubiquitin-protein ligase RHB1A isoform X2 [Asparagus officinalis]|uniref:probable E3 ubiquitin-protein ligase RHB1A isoform X2 n=1 Tax=Asparagus officinalis TaxID=4686 RepID=UPI00098E7A1B|nr:probable E3 ubiquitin-protein ligase RHB1A isoform X2 [Asparagus officinalis]XP_020261423.1 probable E3 ubiquitin-protein ligase RHB1A isoform X2 [Asparagus officinalis]